MSNSRGPFDVLVIGGGPAGIAAAVRAAECGVSVGVVDDNPELGGQIWRGEISHGENENAANWNARLLKLEIAKISGKRVFYQPEPGVLLAEGADDLCELRYKNLVLATGARERFLPFPGWTLPNVMGAGGLQAMVKSGLPIRGKRVVIGGTGPLLLAVAAYLRKHGAEIPAICEQTTWTKLARFTASLVSFPAKIAQGLQLKRQIAGIPLAVESWPVAAHGQDRIESVQISRAGKLENIACDYLACGFHLVPNVELQSLLGCRMNDGYADVDELQQTSVPHVFCAGEPTGIGGVESALIEGQIAGLVAAGEAAQSRKLFGQRRKAQRFARLLDRTFQLRAELKKLPDAKTMICRCEDVSYSRLQPHTSWRGAKLQTRCGMGPCQGRICGPATEFLFNWKLDSVRPPIFPGRVESLALAASKPEPGVPTGGRK